MGELDANSTKAMASSMNPNAGMTAPKNLVSPFPPPPAIVHQPQTQIPVGASLSVEQLFGIAGEMAEQESPMPGFPPPSYCIQLLDTLQHKGSHQFA